MILKVQESDYREMYQYQYDRHLKKPIMKKSLGRKRALLHDTLHSKLNLNHKVTAYETKEGEQYTIELLKKAEEKDMEAQMKFLDKLAEKEAKEKEERDKKKAMRKKLASARPFHDRSTHRKDRCLSAIIKKKEEIRLKNLKKPYIPPEMLIGFNTLSSNSLVWNKSQLSSTQNLKFTTASSRSPRYSHL